MSLQLLLEDWQGSSIPDTWVVTDIWWKFHVNSTFTNIFAERTGDVFNTYFTRHTHTHTPHTHTHTHHTHTTHTHTHTHRQTDRHTFKWALLAWLWNSKMLPKQYTANKLYRHIVSKKKTYSWPFCTYIITYNTHTHTHTHTQTIAHTR